MKKKKMSKSNKIEPPGKKKGDIVYLRTKRTKKEKRS